MDDSRFARFFAQVPSLGIIGNTPLIPLRALEAELEQMNALGYGGGD